MLGNGMVIHRQPARARTYLLCYAIQCAIPDVILQQTFQGHWLLYIPQIFNKLLHSAYRMNLRVSYDTYSKSSYFLKQQIRAE